MYRSSLSLTSVLDKGGWLMPRSGPCTRGNVPVPIVWILGGPQGHSGWVQKIRPYRNSIAETSTP